MNKKFYILFFIMQGLLGSKTVYIPRSITTDSTFDLQPFLDPCVCAKDFTVLFFVDPFHVSSTNSKQITRSLLPECASYLAIRERELGDVASPWLYLLGPTGEYFNSDVSMCPVFKKTGVLLQTYLYFCSIGKGYGCISMLPH